MTQEAVARLVTRVGEHSITMMEFGIGQRFYVLDEFAKEHGRFADLEEARQYAAEREARR